MPVTIKHGEGDASGMAGLALLAGLMQAKTPQAPLYNAPGYQPTPGGGGGGGIRGGGGGMSSRDRFAFQADQLRAASENKKMEIDALAERNKQAADDTTAKMAVAHGLGQEMQEQEYELEVQRMKEQAKVEAEKFDYQYTRDQRNKSAEYNNNKQRISEAIRSGLISEEDGVAANRQNELSNALGPPAQIPADPNRPPPAEEQIFERDGGLFSTDRSGAVRAVVQPKDRPEFLREKAQWEAEAAVLKSEADFRGKIAATVMSEKNLDTGVITSRFANAKEIEKQMKAFRGSREQPAGQQAPPPDVPQQQAPPEPQAQPEPQQSKEWIGQLEEAGIPVSEKFRAMDPRIGAAMSLFSKYVNVPSNKIPPEHRAAFDTASEILYDLKKQE